ncbi:TonB-dependent siderophore receptor [Jiella pelagia]|uniref:TonB-dependent siderophore receptor n=1 Tax=Jiella pelagia TaxID=2986949 RepID=A0ABY7C4F7_9HYPH|nr:TonB-dependent siderophore receptor [Jiella pelagia]WAP70631.1 TonB-dependent siderophore receptor [Jiella pelagia]
MELEERQASAGEGPFRARKAGYAGARGSASRTRGVAALLACGTALGLIQPSIALGQDAGTPATQIELDTVVIDGGTGSAVGPDATIVARDTAVGSKTDTPILDVPAAVSVVTEDEMRQRDVDNLDEVLAYTAGVSSDIYGSDDRYDFYLIRGFYQSNYGTYRDGLPNRNWNFTGSRIEPYGAQRFEVLKGSTSTLFGLNGPGGLVNAITKRPQDQAFGEVYTSFGDGHIETGTDFGAPLTATGDWSYRMTAKWQDGNNGADFTQDDRLYVAPALTWSPDAATSLTILGDYNKRKGNTSHGIPYGSGIDPDTFLGESDYDAMDTEEFNIGWLFSHDFDNGLKVRSNARYTNLDLTYKSVYPGAALAPGSSSVARSSLGVYGKSESFLIDNQLQYDASVGMFDSRTLVGVDYSHYDIKETRDDGTASPIDITNPNHCGRGCVIPYRQLIDDTEIEIVGLYAQEELTIDERWILTFGGRYDHVEQTNDYDYDYGGGFLSQGTDQVTDEAFTSRLGLTYKATDEVSLYANYSESFQPIGTSRASLAEPAKPQEGTQYEVGAKYAPVGLDALFTLALFDLTQSNVTQWDPNYTAQYQLGEVNVRGVELEGKMALDERMNLTLAYSYWDAEIKEDVLGNTGNRPQLVPEHIASIWADYTIPGEGMIGDLTLGAGLRYFGPSYADDANTIDLDSRTTVDAALTYKVTESATLQVNATNIFDKRTVAHVDTFSDTAYYNDGRTVRGTLRYTW